MMKKVNCSASGKFMPLFFTAFILSATFSPLYTAAQLQSSILTISGWTPGTVPVFSGSQSNVINLSYGDSLATSIDFSGYPDDGLGTDNDNMASMSFSYSYTVYLTPVGDSFSTATSISVGVHAVSAYQSCSSGTVPPWSIAYDSSPAIDTNSINISIADHILDCVPVGDYHVDVVFNTYALNATGPNVQPIQLMWSGYANSSGALTSLAAPSTSNTSPVSIDYLLSSIAYIHVSQPQSCPTLILQLPSSIEETTVPVSATAIASYPGQCPQSSCTYLWSDGQTTPTATGLPVGIYTVTVTSPCGATAQTSVSVYTVTRPDEFNVALLTPDSRYQQENFKNIINQNELDRRIHTKESDAGSKEVPVETNLNLYPNPAKNKITIDIYTGANAAYSLRIFDIVGNQVIIPAENVSIGADGQKINLNLDQLSSGAYLYELVTDKTYRGKFIKQ